MCNDLAIAQRICDELNQGNTHAVLELMQLYGKSLEVFAKNQVIKTYYRHMNHYLAPGNTDETQTKTFVQDLMQEFWLDKILKEKAVCSYQRRNGASLKTFFFVVMRNLIMNSGRKIERRKEISVDNGLNHHDSPDPVSHREEEILSHIDDPDLANDTCQQQLNHQFVCIALERLSVRRPRDAKLIFWFMEEDLTYLQMAQRELLAESVPLDDEILKKKENAIRKQYTRKKSGSQVRFAEIYMRVLNENGYEFEMINNQPTLKRTKP